MNKSWVCKRILEIRKNPKRWNATVTAQGTLLPMKGYVDKSKAPHNFEDQSALVFANVISEVESEKMVQDINLKMKRKRWEEGHWDSVITKYKETELDQILSPMSINVIHRIRCHIENVCFSGNHDVPWLPVHAIHLHKEGKLSAHVDSVKFSGKVVCGLSLLSDAIMRLKHHDHSEKKIIPDSDFVDLYLPKRSLYILSGLCRYEYTHEILPSGAYFRFGPETCKQIIRQDRVSVIFRDSKEPVTT